MADPLSTAAGIAGLLSLGIQVTQSLITFYSAYKNRDNNLAKISQNLGDLQNIFRSLETAVQDCQFQDNAVEILKEVNKATQGCQEIIKELEEECQKFHSGPAANLTGHIQVAGYHAAYPFRKSTLQKLAEDVSAIQENLSLALDILRLSEFKSLLERINPSQLPSTIYNWLEAPDASIDHNAACAKRHSNTGLWFINSHHFKNWLVEYNSFLWVNGFAGCGKSVLCSTAIQHTFHEIKDKHGVGIAFFYFSFSDETKQNSHGMLCALLLQLSVQLQAGETHLEQLYESYKLGTPPVGVLLDSLQSVVSQFQEIFILLDALDESPKDHEREDVLRIVGEIRKWSLPGLHLLVTSRNHLDIHKSLDPSPEEALSMKNPEINQDIANFVSDQLKNDPRLQRWKTQHDGIQEQLTQHAQGVFRYAEGQLRALRQARNWNQLDNFLHTQRQDLDQTYEEMLCGIDEVFVEGVKQILTILCLSTKPVTTDELISALTDARTLNLSEPLNIGDEGQLYRPDGIAEICEGLVRVSVGEDDKGQPTSVACIAHSSVQEYLQSDRILLQKAARFAIQKANTVVPEIAYGVSHQRMYSHLKDSKSDSGYASASRPATEAVSSEPVLQHNIEPWADGRLDEIQYSYNEDIQSLPSDDDDIGSLVSNETTNEGLTGKALMRVFLAEEPEFGPLSEKLLTYIGRHRFVENMRRLLKSFYKNLSAEAEGETENAVAGLLRSRRGRLRISQQLVIHIQQKQEELQEQDRVGLRILAEDKNLVETRLARFLQEPADTQNFEGQQDEFSTSSTGDSSETDEFPHISELEVFVHRTRAFQVLLKDTMLVFLPTELRQVLLSIPKEHIWLSQEQDLSLINRMKIWVEDKTQVRWNWWPLEARKRMLQDGESRMFWQCTCGEQQWEEISAEQHELVEKILALSDKRPQLSHWCRTKRTRVFLGYQFKGMFQKVPSVLQAMTSSAAAQKYTPPGNVALASSPRNKVPTNGGSQPTETVPAHIHQNSSITDHQGQIAAQHPANQGQGWILFGVQGPRRTLTPSQISVHNQSTDYTVFQELKECYQANRGRLRLWFSIWRLEFCEVVKFNRLTLERMVHEYRDLPTQQDYQYSPHAGTTNVKNPPISPHLFQALFYTCQFPCNWPIPHDCLQPPTGAKNIERIPKRVRCFERDQTSPIWGLEAVFAVSPARVLIYHCIMVAGPFAFFGWWLKAHPDDLQNASIPVTIVLGVLSLFWSGSGILTSRSIE